MRMLAALLSALLAAGCAIDGVLEDERDDAFLGGKADDATLAEGTPAALGVLQVANEATLEIYVEITAMTLVNKQLGRYFLILQSPVPTKPVAEDRPSACHC